MNSLDYKNLRPVGLWLAVCAASVFLMALIGAVTRLTESGLSIMEWNPVMGALPPLSEREWQRVFDLYKQSGEYRLQNSWMELADFKKIFFWEWLHRLWGRMIGLVYAVPFFVFLWRGHIPAPFKKPLWGLLLLGALQGALGWFMVASGFADRTDVSHYRLAAHLGLAFVIFGLLVYFALKMLLPPQKLSDAADIKRLSMVALKLAFITMIWGAFVAGLNAGLVYNSFPMMGTYPWPTEGLDMQPVWTNLFENHATVQFIHRVLAVSTLAAVVWLWWCGRHMSGRAGYAVHTVLCLGLVQVTLGIATLLSSVWLPLAVMHQAGAMALFAGLIWIRFEIKDKK